MKKIVILFGIMLLSGCTIIPKPESTTATYNFAVYASHEKRPSNLQSTQNGKKILVPNATAPQWLDTPAIHYRLAYHSAVQTLTYANSRWSSPPAFLLTQQIKERIASGTHHLVIKDSSVAIADFELHIELEEFSQIFDSLSESHVSVRFRASVVNNAHRLIAQKIFSTIQPSPEANAAGAVNAFAIVSDRLVDELVDWLNTTIDNIV